MNLPSPVIAAHPPSARARAGTASWPFGAVAAGVFYYFLRGTGSRARALILNGNTEAGAAKLAAYAFIAGGIRPS